MISLYIADSFFQDETLFTLEFKNSKSHLIQVREYILQKKITYAYLMEKPFPRFNNQTHI